MKPEHHKPTTIVLNGCFSVGKSTLARELAQLLPMCSLVDLDLLTSLTPPCAHENLDCAAHFRRNVQAVLSNNYRASTTSMVPIAAVNGITSTTVIDLRRMLNWSDDVYELHIKASPQTVLQQNAHRTDVSYPEDIVRECWQAAEECSESLGYPFSVEGISKKESAIELRNLIRAGKLPPMRCTKMVDKLKGNR